MTRKHFRILAEALKSSNADEDTCKAVGAMCAGINPRFKMNLFLEACGVA
jgi:hypothetical protein